MSPKARKSNIGVRVFVAQSTHEGFADEYDVYWSLGTFQVLLDVFGFWLFNLNFRRRDWHLMEMEPT